MSSLADVLQRAELSAAHHPWPRAIVDPQAWSLAVSRLAEGSWSLLSLWGDPDAVHMALLEPGSTQIGVLTIACPDGRYPSVGQRHPPALRLERALRDLYGHEAEPLADDRPWLDHGLWTTRHPLGQATPAPAAGLDYPFLPGEGESLHQIPVGPVHAGIIEPGHFRFTASGETVVRLEARLGYVHKGIDRLFKGADLERAVKLAGRTSGDSTVAYAFAFSRAVEAALGIEAPARAESLRAIAAELERLANHLGDVGAICNDAAFALMHAHCGALREQVLRAADECFGHRLMRDLIVPGGMTGELDVQGMARLRTLLQTVRQRFPALVELYESTASLQDRTVGAGTLKPELASQYAAGGFVGRASGRDFDARRTPGYPPYPRLHFEVAVLEAGDVDARVWVRIREIEQSMALLEQLADDLPEGASRIDVSAPGEVREGMALVEGFRGDILAWVRLAADGRVERCHLRDPSWFQWPLLEAAIEGNIVADFPLCNKSFNCSYSGHDL